MYHKLPIYLTGVVSCTFEEIILSGVSIHRLKFSAYPTSLYEC
jgi:hypothetical protein